MTSKWNWLLAQVTRLLWVRATLFAIIGVITALAGVTAEQLVPEDIPDIVGANAVGSVLNVLASSMLATTTFSLGVMVSAYSAATTNVTPRATRLLMQDSTTQNVLSTFIGSFLFSLVGIVTLTIEGYGQRGRLILFIVTIGVIVLIVVTLLRWIDHLSRLGRVTETTSRVEEVATRAIRARAKFPNLGGLPLAVDDPIEGEAEEVLATKTGYVQHVDVGALHRWAEEEGATVDLLVLPGSFVNSGRPVARVVYESPPDGEEDDAKERAHGVRSSVTVGEERTFDQDPRFGIVVLAEIATRALSPATNDSGTAIDVIGRLVRVLSIWAETGPDDDDVKYPRVRVPSLSEDDLLEDAFMMIGRDGADKVEIQLRLQKAIALLASIGGEAFRSAASRQSAASLVRSEAALTAPLERERVRAVAVVSITTN